MNASLATAFLLEKYGKKNPAQIKSGDTIKVHQRIKEGVKERVQIFEGLVIATKHGQGLDGTFTVRKIAAGGVGVERTYAVHSPNIVKIERIKTATVSRAKLYYMRDRRGKSARFKDEGPSYMAWDESGVQTVAPEVEEVPAEEVAIDEATVEESVVEVEEKTEEASAETEKTKDVA